MSHFCDGAPDPVVVERAFSGDRLKLNPAEAAQVYELLEAARCTAAEIGDRLGVSPRTVERWRSGVQPLPAHWGTA